MMVSNTVIDLTEGDDEGKMTVETSPIGNFLSVLFWPFLSAWYYVTYMWIGTKWLWIEKLTRHNAFLGDMIPRRPSDVAVITGGTKGIGLEVLKRLLYADMHVILGCRSLTAGKETLERLRRSGITSGTAECLYLDLTSLDSVRQFAKAILIKNTAIHVLINNAGIMAVGNKTTLDGHDVQFQVNYLSHFLLTTLLLPRMAQTAAAPNANHVGRIVNVSSCAQYTGHIDFSDLEMRKRHETHQVYCNTKLMQVVHSNFLNALLTQKGIKIRAFSVHPGVLRTDLYNNFSCRAVCQLYVRLMLPGPERGGDAVTFTALSPSLEEQGGLFLANSKVYRQVDQALDPMVQKKLWDVSCTLANIDRAQLAANMNVEQLFKAYLGSPNPNSGVVDME